MEESLSQEDISSPEGIGGKNFAELAVFVHEKYGNFINVGEALDRLAGYRPIRNIDTDTPGMDKEYDEAFQKELKKKEDERISAWEQTKLDTVALEMINFYLQDKATKAASLFDKRMKDAGQDASALAEATKYQEMYDSLSKAFIVVNRVTGKFELE